jgi:CubicO group peptidase (beta-lactamase class C family)
MITRFSRITPESVGIPSSAIQAFVQATEERVGGLHSFMLLRHGQVAAEAWWAPYAPERRHLLFSLSKSFTSTAVGFAVAEGLLTVDNPVLAFFPDVAPRRVSRNLGAMQVRHLLSMNTGHAEDTTGAMVSRRGGDWARAFLSLPVKHQPGTFFVYNTGATYMLSAIVQRLTGQTLLEYLAPRLFAPLGIEGATWESCPKGVNTGGFGLSVRTEDIACLGQMYLQKGVWRGQRILPESWVNEATAVHSDNASQSNPDWQQGYGYQFWRSRHGAYRGDGAFGQYCLVMPEQDAVLAITSGVRDMQAVLDLVWQHLLPAMGSAALPANPEGHTALTDTLAHRAVTPASGTATCAVGREVSGRYTLDANPLGLRSLTLRFKRSGAAVRLAAADQVTQLVCAPGEWQQGQVTLRRSAARSPHRAGLPSPPLMASGAWIDEATYALRLCYYETPFVVDLTCRFAAGGLTVTGSINASFGPTEWPPIAGRKA